MFSYLEHIFLNESFCSYNYLKLQEILMKILVHIIILCVSEGILC
jgi:hypothetical protein